MSLQVWQVDPAHLTPYYNLALCCALEQAGCNVHYATSAFSYDPILPEFSQTDYFYFPFTDRHYHSMVRRSLKAFLYPLGHWRFLHALDVNRPAIVHIQWTRLPILDHWLITQIKRRGVPVIYTAHDVEPLFPYAFDLSTIYAAVDAIIVHAQANRNLLLHNHPNLPESKVHVIPHPASTWDVPLGAERNAARSELGIPLNVPVLLFFGSSRPYKGLDILAAAFTLASEVRSDLWLIVAGRLDDSQIISSLRQPHVVIESGFVPSDRVWSFHFAADIAVFPYRQISQSGALITAMSFALPVIVTQVGGMPETVDGNGWVVPSNDPVILAGAILEAIGDMSRLASLGNRSAQLIDERHLSAHIARKTIELYDEVIDCVSSTVLTV